MLTTVKLSLVNKDYQCMFVIRYDVRYDIIIIYERSKADDMASLVWRTAQKRKIRKTKNKTE